MKHVVLMLVIQGRQVQLQNSSIQAALDFTCPDGWKRSVLIVAAQEQLDGLNTGSDGVLVRPETPASLRYNEGLQTIRDEYKHDAVMVINSGDFISQDYFSSALRRVRAGEPFGCAEMFIWNGDEGQLGLFSLTHRTFCTGRMYPKDVLVEARYKLWSSCASVGLDDACHKRLQAIGHPVQIWYGEGGAIIGVRSEADAHNWKWFINNNCFDDTFSREKAKDIISRHGLDRYINVV